MTLRTYQSPEQFKQALEQRLLTLATSGAALARQRQLLVFDRFMARVVSELGDAAILKGGLALELRIDGARSTNDVDLRMTGSPQLLLARLQAAARRDAGDHLSFEVSPDAVHPEIHAEGMQYDGFRFRANCQLARKRYGNPFGVDVAFGEPILGEPEVVVAADTLGFIGVPPPTLRVYPLGSHIAEKLHAYTMPRVRPNSRVKDLPDLALLATVRPVAADVLRSAIAQTFAHRGTHAVPAALPAPSAAWASAYAKLARDDQLAWPTLDAVTRAAQQFLDPVLAGALPATWSPAAWAWS